MLFINAASTALAYVAPSTFEKYATSTSTAPRVAANQSFAATEAAPRLGRLATLKPWDWRHAFPRASDTRAALAAAAVTVAAASTQVMRSKRTRLMMARCRRFVKLRGRDSRGAEASSNVVRADLLERAILEETGVAPVLDDGLVSRDDIYDRRVRRVGA